MRASFRLRIVPLALLALASLVRSAAAAAPPTTVASPSETAYRAALRLVAAGGPGALDALLEAELEAVPSASDEELAQLSKGYVAVARRLASASAETLVPIVRLHEAAYRSHLEARRLPLAIHSRRHAVELIELYINLSRRPDAKRLGSELLTSIGGSVQEASMASVAIELYERALALEPDNAAALISLAGLCERQGSYERSLPYLEELLRRHPSHREARLRLGINLLRLGRRSDGTTALEEILAHRQADWILSLAYQELARLAAAARDPGEGRRLLLEARRRLPEDSSLVVQIAYLSERLGGRAGSSDLVEALQASARSEGPSPRSLYSRVAGESLEDLRSALEASARRRWPELARALGGDPDRKAAS